MRNKLKNLAAYIRVFVMIAMYPCIRLVRSFMEKHGASKETVTSVYLAAMIIIILLVIVSCKNLADANNKEKTGGDENGQSN